MLRRKGGYKHNGLSPMDVVLGIVLSILGLLVVLPFYNAIMISFVTEAEYFRTPFVFYPHAPTLEAYRTLLETGNILVGYGNTLFSHCRGIACEHVHDLFPGLCAQPAGFPGT